MPSITKVWLDESVTPCTECQACMASCAEVFDVPQGQKMSVLTEDLAVYKEYEEELLEAASECPVGTIALEVDGSGQRDNSHETGELDEEVLDDMGY